MSTLGAVAFFLVLILVIGAIVGAYRRYYGSRANRFGYASRAAYMRAVPLTEAEKREAVDQAFTGLAICLLGLALPPLMLVGLLPLVIGGRKCAYALMGLGYVDDADQLRE